MPLSISARERRLRAGHRNRGRVRADDERGEQQVVAEGGHVSDPTVGGAAERRRGRFVLRRTLRRHVGGLEPVRRQPAGQHDLRVVLERVGDDAGVERASASGRSAGSRTGSPASRASGQSSPARRCRAPEGSCPSRSSGWATTSSTYLYVLHALAERRVQQHAERGQQHERGRRRSLRLCGS